MKTIALGLVSATALAASVVAAPVVADAAVARPTTAVTTTAPATPRTVSTKRLIIRAVTTEAVAGGVPASKFQVERVRVSRVNGAWAAAHLEPTAKAKAEIDGADVVLRRTNAGWRVTDLGTDQVGCGVAPAKVLRSLGLTC